METQFYEFAQNNSGGHFDSDETLCHRLIIEATSEKEAINKAEDLGCYWDGVDKDIDCSCCGDRWYQPYSPIDIDNINTRWGGYEVGEWIKESDDVNKTLESFKSKYPNAKWFEEPKVIDKYGSKKITAKIEIDNIERYAQILANEHGGWTTPEVRIFYKNGQVTEIFNKN